MNKYPGDPAAGRAFRRMALLLAILPATAAVMGALVLQQRPSPVEAFAIGLVVLAVLLRQGDTAPLPSPDDG